MSWIKFPAVLGAVLLASGCVSAARYRDMRAKHHEEASRNRGLAQQVNQLQNENDRLRNALIAAGFDQEKLERIIDEYQKGGVGLAFAKSPHWKLLPDGGIRLPGLTFLSGSATLSPKGTAALDAVAAELGKMNVSWVLVDGHTDSDPITKSNHRSNWELSGKRAATVVDYLVKKGVVNAKRCNLRGFGEHQPIEGATKAQNRRVEIFAIPAGKGGQLGPTSGRGSTGGGGVIPRK